MYHERFAKTRKAALGLVLPAMLAATAEGASARRADNFSIYSGSRIQYINYHEDPGLESSVLNETVLQQVMKNAIKFTASRPDLAVSFDTAAGSYYLDFTLGRLVDQQVHDIHLVADQNAAYSESPMGCAPGWKPGNPLEATDDCTLAGSLETYLMPAPEGKQLAAWPGVDPSVVTLARAACHNVLEAEFSLPQLNPMFGGQVNGRFGEVQDAVSYLTCESFAGMVAAKTAGLSEEQYLAMAEDNVMTGSFDGLDFKAALPVIPWSAVDALKSPFVA